AARGGAAETALRRGAVTPQLLASDLFSALVPGRDRFDLITANPPYIAEPDLLGLPVDVGRFEPKLAPAGGPGGLAILRRIVAEAPRFLEPGGALAVEVGAGQAPDVQRLFE